MTGDLSSPFTASVIIPAHNTGAVIWEQLQALASQEEAPPFEVIVADNNSTDGTRAAAESWQDRLAVRVIDASGPASASWARNRGAESARAEILLFCDSDDLVSRRWVHELVSAVQEHSHAVIAGALHHERFNAPEVLAAYGIGPDPLDPPTGVSRDPAPGFAGFLPTVPGGNFAIRREHYIALGGMDPSFPGGSEETDFAWRAQQADLPVLTAPAAIVDYRLKHTPRALFRQQRIQQLARIFLWARYREHGMAGPSMRYSARQALRHAPGLLAPQRGRRLNAARITGGNLGALQGILRYASPVPLSPARKETASP